MHAAAPRHPEESPALLRARSGIFRRVSLRSFSLFPPSPHPAIFVLLHPLIRRPPLAPRGARARASTRASGVSACTYIRYLSAYIWVPIYRYQMVNERVDARSGRPQLAATQSFVYRGAVCATARTGWPRNVGIFFCQAPAARDTTARREHRGDGYKGDGYSSAYGYGKAEMLCEREFRECGN